MLILYTILLVAVIHLNLDIHLINLSQLRSNLDIIMANNDCCSVIVTGDFNKLNIFC